MNTMLTMTMPERFIDAGAMTAKGMLLVFAVLIVLMLALILMKNYFTRGEKKSDKGKSHAVEAAPVSAPKAPAPVVAKKDEGAIVAAITAAIAMTLAAEQGGTLGASANAPANSTSFRVVSFRRVSGRTNWNA